MKLNVAPGFSIPEFHTLVSEVAVCAVLSPLVQITVVPTATVVGFGAVGRRRQDRCSVKLHAHMEVGPDGVGLGVGVVGVVTGDEDEEPHEAARMDVNARAMR